MSIIIGFFVLHWVTSIFAQTFFLHRYAAHQMFQFRHPIWERLWYIFTIVAQGPSFLNPYGYAILHRMHHKYSDTPQDPHSPHHSPNFFAMMLKTKHIYDDYAYDRIQPPKEFAGPVPRWSALDRLGQSWLFRIGSGSLYALFYLAFVPAGMEYLYLLLPIHWLMGPIHGAIVNWGGHKYGYVNFKKTKDQSRNTLPFDFLTMGELFQNNHHGRGTSPNFAYRWFEIDPAYQMMRLMDLLHIIKIERVSVHQKDAQSETGKVPQLLEA